MDRIVQEDRVFIAPCFPVVIEALDQAPATLLINIDRRQKCAGRVHAVLEAVDPFQHLDRSNACLFRVPLAGFGILGERSEEHTSELQSLMRISYAVFCLKKKKKKKEII